MKSKVKTVYYCDYCRKHSLVKHTLEHHEERCTGNINRVCHWDWNNRTNAPHDTDESIEKLVKHFKRLARTTITDKDIGYLADCVYDCPACMLTVLKQTGLDSFKWGGWNYPKQVEEFNKLLQERIRDEEYYEMYA